MIPSPGTKEFVRYRVGQYITAADRLRMSSPDTDRPIVPRAGTRARMLYDIRKSIAADDKVLGMPKAEREEMIAFLWSTGMMDTVDIAMACGCRESMVQRVLTRQRDARR